MESIKGFMPTLRWFMSDLLTFIEILVAVAAGAFLLWEYSFFSYGDFGIFFDDEILSLGYKAIYNHAVATYFGLVLITSTLAASFRVKYLAKKRKSEILHHLWFGLLGLLGGIICATVLSAHSNEIMYGLGAGIIIGFAITVMAWFMPTKTF